MKRSLATGLTVAFAVAASAMAHDTASAASLPAVEASTSNAVPSCVTPGRLNAFLSDRNPGLDRRYGDIGVDYMRHGEALGLRWDYAFFQMVVETNSLKYTGDVRAAQNNFAGLGATGGGVRGESFRSVSDGVRAHLEHVAIYAGKYIDDPVADRTRKVQSWGILDKWRRKIRGPVTYSQLGNQWAPPDRGYARDIQAIADIFYSSYCNRADPQPELLAKLRGGTTANTRVASKAAPDRSASATPNRPPKKTTAPANTTGVAVLNGATSNAVDEAKETRVATLSPGAVLGGAKTTTDVPAAATTPPSSTGSCKVWEASYGGSRAVLIKAVDGNVTNFTVLDVNKGREKSEADAFIAAYAKGGLAIEEFDSPKSAMKKAFKLCPDK